MPSCNQQNYPINCNFRRASSKHLITLTPKIYPFLSKSLSKISSANALPGLLPMGQVRRQSYLPKPKIYLSRTTGRGLFRALGKIGVPRDRIENQQTQSMCNGGSGNRIQAMLLEGGCSHHSGNSVHMSF